MKWLIFEIQFWIWRIDWGGTQINTYTNIYFEWLIQSTRIFSSKIHIEFVYTWLFTASDSFSDELEEELSLSDSASSWTFITSGSSNSSSFSGISCVSKSSSLTIFRFPFGADCFPDFLELTVVSGVSRRLVGRGAGSGFS